MKNFLIICTIAFSFMACEKPAGEGGTSVITGKVYEVGLWDDPTTSAPWDTSTPIQLAAEKEVYIIYSGENSDVYDDSFDTHWNGEFRFEYLRKGKYTVFTYADFDTSGIYTGDYPVFQHITIDENHKTYILNDFILHK